MADFVVLFPGVPGYFGFTQDRAVLVAFGNAANLPRRLLQVLVWNRNLLSKLS